MKIYFCGSIRGGRNDAAIYYAMVEQLKRYGSVLTEHVGDPNLTHWGGDGNNDYIYQRDTGWLRECDIVIAECSQPSHGVGYEIAYAEAIGKPIHVFYGRSDGRLSAMLSGDSNLNIHYYDTPEALSEMLARVMEAR